MCQGASWDIGDSRRCLTPISTYFAVGTGPKSRVVKSRRLQWAGHVVRAPAERAIVTAMNGQVNAVRPMGRPRKRWSDKVREVLNAWE